MLIASIEKLEDEVFNHLFELWPRHAVSLGLHAYDGRLPDVSKATIHSWSTTARDLIERIRSVDKTTIDHERRLDTLCLENILERTLFEIDQLDAYTSRPNTYTLQLSTIPYVSREYARIDARIRALNNHLAQTPNFLKQANENLDHTLPRPIRDVAIAQAEGVLRDLEGQASLEAGRASTHIQSEFEEKKKDAETSIREFVENLKKWATTSDFALGREKFQKILWMNDRLKQPLEEVLKLALGDLETNLALLWELGENLSKSLQATIDSISKEHPMAERLIEETTNTLEETKRFLIEKDLVSIPEGTRCRVVPTPALMRATTTAAMSSPGPFEREGLEGLYYVTPVEHDWDEKRKEDWLRHLNYSTLKDISIHEVYPGHFTHRMFTRAFVKSKTRRCYWNNAFSEGWAHYAEEMMLDQGFGDKRLRFMQLKEALLRDCRFIVSFRMHTEGMSLDQAKTFIMENAFMSEQTAGREALRGTFDHSYYGYTLGKLMIKRARSRFFEAHPSATIKAFHDKLLSLGSAPVGLLEDLVVN